MHPRNIAPASLVTMASVRNRTDAAQTVELRDGDTVHFTLTVPANGSIHAAIHPHTEFTVAVTAYTSTDSGELMIDVTTLHTA